MNTKKYIMENLNKRGKNVFAKRGKWKNPLVKLFFLIALLGAATGLKAQQFGTPENRIVINLAQTPLSNIAEGSANFQGYTFSNNEFTILADGFYELTGFGLPPRVAKSSLSTIPMTILRTLPPTAYCRPLPIRRVLWRLA